MSRNVVAWGRQVLARHGRRLLSVLMVAAIFAVLGWSVIGEWDTVKHYPWQLEIAPLVLASAFHSLALGVTFVVWHLMIRRLGHFADVRRNAYIYYVSTLAKRVPGAIWYISGRLLMYQEEGVTKPAVLNATILETVLIGSAGALVYVMLLPFYAYDSTRANWIIATIGLVAIGLFSVRPRLLLDATNYFLRRWKRTPIEVDLTRQDLILWAVLYMLPGPVSGVSLYFLIRAVTAATMPDLVSAMVVWTLSMLVGLMTMVLPGGLGLKELALATLLSQWMPLSAGVVVAVAFRLLQTFDDAAWAAVVWVLFGRREMSGDR